MMNRPSESQAADIESLASFSMPLTSSQRVRELDSGLSKFFAGPYRFRPTLFGPLSLVSPNQLCYPRSKFIDAEAKYFGRA